MGIEEIYKGIKDCKKCKICGIKVIYRGDDNPEVLLIGEAPGKNEEKQGKPFVGLSGKCLDKWITRNIIKEGLRYGITNVVKCRPSSWAEIRGKNVDSNRTPTTNEVQNCSEHLKKQIMEYKPEVLICLGRTAMHGMMDIDKEFEEKIRKDWFYNSEGYIGLTFLERELKIEDKLFCMYLVPHPRWYISHGREMQDFTEETRRKIKEAVSGRR